MKEAPMAIILNALRAVVAVLTIGLLWPLASAVAQAIPGAGSPSVLPTGGGKACSMPLTALTRCSIITPNSFRHCSTELRLLTNWSTAMTRAAHG